MLLTPFEYSIMFLCNGKIVSKKTVIRRCEAGMLPTGHKATKLSSGWVIEIAESAPATGMRAPSGMMVSAVHYNWR